MGPNLGTPWESSYVVVLATRLSSLISLQTGFFLDIAKRIHRWLGHFMLIAAVIANTAQFNGMLATSSRVMQASKHDTSVVQHG